MIYRPEWGRVYEIIGFRRLLLVKPTPTGGNCWYNPLNIQVLDKQALDKQALAVGNTSVQD